MSAPRWEVTEWGWDMTPGGSWSAQVYDIKPWEWRVFRGHKVVAQGTCTTANVARRRGKAVLLALMPKTRRSKNT